VSELEEGGGGMRSGRPVPGVFPPPEAARPTLVGERWAVSAGHPLVAQVAADVFGAGGNAVDAGVAAGLAANVVQVDMCSLGGIAPLLVRPAGSDAVWSVSGVGTWGHEVSVAAFRARFGDDMPLGGPVAVVPGAPDAWISALERWGTWSFAEAAAPAIALARDGWALDRRTAANLAILGTGFAAWPSSRAVLWPAGRAPRTGERLQQPALAALLERLAAAGSFAGARSAFYEGEVAEAIVAGVRADRGWLTREDLAAFRAEVAPAVSRGYRGWTVHTTGPWSQGPALLQALAILESDDLAALGHSSADHLHLLAEAMKLAFADRERFYGDPRHVDVALAHLLSDAHAAELRARIDPARAVGVALEAPAGAPRRTDTTYLCTVDAAGGAFSATPSDTADGGPILPGLGILVSPRGVQSRALAGHPNAIAPGKRPRVTPAPALALGPEGRVCVFGCPGGDVILQAMLQAFSNVVDFGMEPQPAVEAPRAVSLAFPTSFFPFVSAPGRLSVESGVPERVRAELAGRGHDVEAWPPWEFDAGGVGLIADVAAPAGGRRVLGAAADPRRSGYALAR